MIKEDRILLKSIDNNIVVLKKKMLKGDFTIDKDSKAFINMIKIQINEMDVIARLIKNE